MGVVMETVVLMGCSHGKTDADGCSNGNGGADGVTCDMDLKGGAAVSVGRLTPVQAAVRLLARGYEAVGGRRFPPVTPTPRQASA